MESKRKERLRLGLGVAALVLAIGAGAPWLWSLASGRPDATADGEVPGPRLRSGPDAARAAVRPRPGLERVAGRYRLDYTLSLAAPASDGTRKTAEVRLRGELELAGPLQRGEATWLAARAAVDRLDVNDIARKVTDFAPGEPPPDLARPWLLQVDPTGRVQEVRFEPGTTLAVRGLWAAVAAGLQFVVPADADPAAWQADEHDVNAGYRARYERLADGSYRKAWQARVGADPHDPARPALYDSTATARFRFIDGGLRDVELHQAAHASAGRVDDAGLVRFRTDVTLAWRGAAAAGWAAHLDPRAYEPLTGEAVALRPPPTRTAEAPPRPVADLAALAGEAAARGATTDRHAVRDEIVRALVRDPSQVAAVQDQLRTGVADEPTERTLIEALVQAGTPAAQSAVAGLLADDVAPPLRDRVLAGAAFVARPDPILLAALTRLAYDPAQPALGSRASMTLGAAAGRLADTDPDQADTVVKGMLAAATPIVGSGQPGHPDQGETPPAHWKDRAQWLDGLGNAGAPAALPLVLQGLHDVDENVRVAAAHALRFLPPAEVKSAMLQAMRTDDSIFVRKALLLAARYMGAAAMQDFVTKALYHDESEFVRLGAAYTVATWAMTAPGLRKVLAGALAQEGSAKVRETLKNFLEPGRVMPPFHLVEGKVAAAKAGALQGTAAGPGGNGGQP